MADEIRAQPRNSLAALLSDAINSGGGGAAFGFYPQMNPRRQGLPSDSANLPIDVLRGRLAGLLGAPADIANLLRSPSPTEMFGDVSYEAPAQFPYTTEKFLKDLPLAPTSRVGEVAGQAASFVPLNPMPAVRGMQKIGQMAGEELAATMMGQRPGSMMSKVVPQPLFAVPPEQGLFQAKPQAPVSDIGFYSAAEQAALNLARNKGTGQSFINDLMKAPDVKKEELAYTGLDDFLRDKPNVTKQEVQDFLANNRVDVQETQLGGSLSPEMQTTRDALNDKYKVLIDDIANAKSQFEEGKISYAQVRNIVSNNQTQIEALNSQIKEINNTIPPTKFDKYTLAGGENYREILLTLPEKAPAMYPNFETYFKAKYSDYANPNNFENPAYIMAQRDAKRNWDATGGKIEIDDFSGNKVGLSTGNYTSSHFNEPNILAHMRVNDRIDADGKKMLLVEEIQSDWHQAGREKGYKGKGILKELPDNYFVQELKTIDGDTMYVVRNVDNPSVVLNKDYNRQSAINGVINELNATSAGGVPDAPFKDTWYQLALKRLTKYAADNGYERIGLTTGKQQAGRYKLSNEVDEINVIGRTNMATGEKSKSVALDMKSGQSLRIGVNNDGIVDNVSDESIKNFMGKNLSEVVGKDIAKEIMLNNKKTISGEGLDIGGEGMKKYYDEIYPKFLDKYGKKYGASVGETKVNTVMERADNSMIPKMGQEPVRYIDVTPQMKEGTSKGQPLFAAVPALPIATMDYTDPFPDTTR